MEWSDDECLRCGNCGGWGDCYDCYKDDYGFIRDEFLDENGNYYKYKKFLLDNYDINYVPLTLRSDLDELGNGCVYINHIYHRLSIENGKVVITPGINPKSLQLACQAVKRKSIPIENERICDMANKRRRIN